MGLRCCFFFKEVFKFQEKEGNEAVGMNKDFAYFNLKTIQFCEVFPPKLKKITVKIADK